METGMTATETRLIAGIDPAIWVSYNRHPDDWTLIDALTDMAMEQGRDDLADFFRWVKIKKRVPFLSPVSFIWTSDGFGEVPTRLADYWKEYDESDTAANALWRLSEWWRLLRPERKAEVWKWTPEKMP